MSLNCNNQGISYPPGSVICVGGQEWSCSDTGNGQWAPTGSKCPIVYLQPPPTPLTEPLGWFPFPPLQNGTFVDAAIGTNQDGRLEVFGLSSNGEVWHCWQINPNGAWTDNWTSLGGTSTALMVLSNEDGRLELFALNSVGELWHRCQTVPNGGWTAWNPLGGTSKSMAAGNNLDGRIEVFAINFAGVMFHNWQTSPNGHWAGWYPMPTVPPGGPWIDLSVASNKDGRLEIFALDDSGQLWHCWQGEPGAAWTLSWYSLGGTSNTIAVAPDPNGAIEAFTLNSVGELFHCYQSAPGAGWTGWFPLNGISNAIAVGKNQDRRLQLFAINGLGQLYLCHEPPGGGWSGWIPFYVPAAPICGKKLWSALEQDGRCVVFCLIPCGKLYRTWQDVPNGNWFNYDGYTGWPVGNETVDGYIHIPNG
jgi:hypothetical protein